jgi:hypothetical protein
MNMMYVISDLLWLGPWGLILFLASTVCLLIAIFHVVTKQNGPALMYLAVGWLLLGLAVVGAAMEINDVVLFIKTKQISPQYTPFSMLVQIWRSTVIAVATISLLSLPVLIKGRRNVSDRGQTRIYTLAALTAIAFTCANIVAVILIHESGKYPYSPTISEAEPSVAGSPTQGVGLPGP